MVIKILISGENSYIGKKIEEYAKSYPDKYSINFLSLKKNNWKDCDFNKYDVVLHLAGLVHKKEKNQTYEEYDFVNYQLTKELSELVFESSITHFIFMSTLAVYGLEGSINKEVIINKNTIPVPNTYYGKSKLKAEKYLSTLASENFKVSIIRPPMVYGDDCPGNYNSLKKIALTTPFFPLISNKRSAVDIKKLCEDLIEIIEKRIEGIIVIQDEEFMNTSQTVKKISDSYNKKIYLSTLLGKFILLFGRKSKIVNKVFGNLTFEENY